MQPRQWNAAQPAAVPDASRRTWAVAAAAGSAPVTAAPTVPPVNAAPCTPVSYERFVIEHARVHSRSDRSDELFRVVAGWSLSAAKAASAASRAEVATKAMCACGTQTLRLLTELRTPGSSGALVTTMRLAGSDASSLNGDAALGEFDFLGGLV